MITSKLSRKGRTTVPLAVLTALRITAGDEIAYEVKGHCITLTKLSSMPSENPFPTFTEWNSAPDARL
jgi:antitoxin PrlF